MLLLQHTRKLVAEADNRILRQTGYGPVGGPSSLLRKFNEVSSHGIEQSFRSLKVETFPLSAVSSPVDLLFSEE